MPWFGVNGGWREPRFCVNGGWCKLGAKCIGNHGNMPRYAGKTQATRVQKGATRVGFVWKDAVPRAARRTSSDESDKRYGTRKQTVGLPGLNQVRRSGSHES